MIWLYRFLFPILFVIGLPFYLSRMFRRGGYMQMMKGRFGYVPTLPKLKNGNKRLWIQAVSVGELLAIEGLVEELRHRPGLKLVISTTTSTGYDLARKKYGDWVEAVVPFPLDFYAALRIAWNRIKPDVCVLMEAEIWPEHIRMAKNRNVGLILVNARLSDKTYKRLLSAKWLQQLMYGSIEHIAAGSSYDAERILNLGIEPSRVSVTGNLKFDVAETAKIADSTKQELLQECWGDKAEDNATMTIIGASTWDGEEKRLIDAVVSLWRKGVKSRLILTPRHAERRADLKSLLESYDPSQVVWRFRSRLDWHSVPQNDIDAPEVYVADTTGELKSLIQLADIAVIGRSFPPHTEGQTPIEAAIFGIPIVYGPKLTNFRAICKSLEKVGGVCRVAEPDDLETELQRLIESKTERSRLVKAASGVLTEGRGSTQRTIERLESYF